MNNTIYGEPVGKWQLGDFNSKGEETSLMGKWIGETPTVSYPKLGLALPERKTADVTFTPVPALILMGLAGYGAYTLYKKYVKKERWL